MSALDWVLISVFGSSLLICAGMGLITSIGVAVGAVGAYFAAVPLLTEPMATVTGWLIGWLGEGSSGWAKALAIGLIVLIGAIIGKLLGGILSFPINIIPGINLLNTLGGATVGLVLGLVLVGVTMLVMRVVTPEWAISQLSESSFVASFIGDNIGKAALWLAPSELRQFLRL